MVKVSSGRIWCVRFTRDRRELLPLFRLADDSEQEIACQMFLGDVLIAVQAGQILGHAQILERKSDDFEIKSLAVIEARQRQGIGRQLIRTAARYCSERKAQRMTVSTSIAAPDAIEFYLRAGFRICGYQRDVFTPERGYPKHVVGTLVPLNDAVEFELVLNAR